jgi:hypothetical protein
MQNIPPESCLRRSSGRFPWSLQSSALAEGRKDSFAPVHGVSKVRQDMRSHQDPFQVFLGIVATAGEEMDVT